MLWRRKRPLDDFAEEIQSHIAIEADQLRDRGKAGADAEATARRLLATGQPFRRRSTSTAAGCFGTTYSAISGMRHT